MLATRAIADEMMDDPALDPAVYAAVLADLAKVNTVTMARRPTLGFLKQVAPRRESAAPLKILDVGFGDGDMLRTIAHWAAHHNIAVELVGIDLNPGSAAAARAQTPDSLSIDYRSGDYVDLAGHGWDVIISSLVAHHMTPDQLIAFLRFMEAEARAGWFINDLHRHGVAWLGYPLLARLARWHPIVRHDGQLSIARSYRPHEWPPLLAAAGVIDARVRRVFPLRLCVCKLR